jgi:hypothetical protein
MEVQEVIVAPAISPNAMHAIAIQSMAVAGATADASMEVQEVIVAQAISPNAMQAIAIQSMAVAGLGTKIDAYTSATKMTSIPRACPPRITTLSWITSMMRRIKEFCSWEVVWGLIVGQELNWDMHLMCSIVGRKT